MKKHYLIILFSLLIPLMASQAIAHAIPQDEITDTTEVVNEEEDILASSSMWDLVGQAGNIRYPIFAILVIGLFLIGLKVFDLYKDKQKSNPLMNTPFPDLNLNQMTRTLERQPENMLSSVMAKLLNVFQTNKNADYLHDEISNYSHLQQNNFNSFRNRIDFLSDTAGALGLLGTVWGMFMVFSSGNLEKESILAGMGLALMSTLLGLIVSIVLNFSSTLTEGFFSKRLEKVTDKADEMRFRLIELSNNPESTEAPPTRTTLGNDPKNLNYNSKQIDVINKKAPDNLRKKNTSKEATSNHETEEHQEPEAAIKPEKLILKSKLDKTYKAGETIKDISLQLIDSNGEPIEDEEVEVVLMHAGKVNQKTGRDLLKTNSDGIVIFEWSLFIKPGTQKAGIRVAEKQYHNIKKEIAVTVKAAEPETLQILNNHQAAETGKSIKKPIVALVKDKFDNPVSEVSITMKVSMGNGTFGNGSNTLTKKTDEDGRVETGFTLGDEPGFNAVDIDLDNYSINKNFQAVGQEVTV